MKTMIRKMAANVNRVRMAIGRMIEAYENALSEMRGTPAYEQLFNSCDMM